MNGTFCNIEYGFYLWLLATKGKGLYVVLILDYDVSDGHTFLCDQRGDIDEYQSLLYTL